MVHFGILLRRLTLGLEKQKREQQDDAEKSGKRNRHAASIEKSLYKKTGRLGWTRCLI